MELINNDKSEDYKNFQNIRKVIVDEFVNYNAYILVDILNLFDLLRFVIVKQNVDKDVDVDIDSLGEKIFQLVKERKANVIKRQALNHFGWSCAP